MICSPFEDGIIFHTEGENLVGRNVQYLVPLRDCEKSVNGHFILNYHIKSLTPQQAAHARLIESTLGEEDEVGGCGVGFFLKTDEMDYLPEEAFGLRIYATNEQFANTVKNGLRGFLDAVCIRCPGAAFNKLHPFAPQILQHLETFPQLRPILPTVAELDDRKDRKEQYSRFTVATISRFHHYFRGQRGTDYLSGDPLAIVPWNEGQDTLSEELRAEWISQTERKLLDGSKQQQRPTFDNLTARVWIKNNYKIEPNRKIEKRTVYQNYLDTCNQKSYLRDTTFGIILNNVFPNIEGTNGGRDKPSYTNLQLISDVKPVRQKRKKADVLSSEEEDE